MEINYNYHIPLYALAAYSTYRDMSRVVSPGYLRGTARNRMYWGRGVRGSFKTIGYRRRAAAGKKLAVTSEELTTRNDRTVRAYDLVVCSRGQEINERERAMIYVRGVSIKGIFSNVGTAGVYTWAHVAVIAVKDGLPLTGGVDLTSIGDFYRGFGTSRTQDFDGTGTGNTNLELATLPLNTDRFHVLWKKSIYLGPPSGSSTGASGALVSTRHIRKYIRINRQFRFEDDSAASSTNLPTQRVQLIYWFTSPNIVKGAPVGSVNAAWRTQLYFREIV